MGLPLLRGAQNTLKGANSRANGFRQTPFRADLASRGYRFAQDLAPVSAFWKPWGYRGVLGFS